MAVPSPEMAENFILSLIEKKADRGLEIIQQAVSQNMDVRIFLKLILRNIRSMLLLRLAPQMKKQLEESLGEREYKFIEAHKDKVKPGDLEKALKILLDAYEIKSRSYLPQLPLELAFLKIIEENNPILPSLESDQD